jgi:hypothetical protein
MYMNLYRFLTCLFLLLFYNGFSKPLVLSSKALKNPPPRIIRTCCSFGSDLHILSINRIKINDITSFEKIGAHSYLGNPKEGNGILYTKRGGFIDLGHLRDQADWTAFIYAKILQGKARGKINLRLGIEGGKKELSINISQDLDSNDAIHLAAKIAYDLSVWHEISTWFGASYVPFLPERYSSFSIEDIYSNLLGVTLGIKAIQSDLPFEEAMTKLIHDELLDLQAVKTQKETYEAMEITRNLWWTREKSLPSRKILIKHQCQAYSSIKPWLIPKSDNDSIQPKELMLIENFKNNRPINDFYELKIKLNLKTWDNKIIKDYNKKELTQRDFVNLINKIEEELVSGN